ncbi:hypothetical protein BJ878DRAFT_480922 [Calycina marina]|uniref:Uncharacterized protein n=1 Tax=Calycina marina TaxID=1763456 RepID=A0A9P7Z1P3_9HELO|nr:hypothetical protein BJ878DRAFT_480922 [Calycina marina]
MGSTDAAEAPRYVSLKGRVYVRLDSNDSSKVTLLCTKHKQPYVEVEDFPYDTPGFNLKRPCVAYENVDGEGPKYLIHGTFDRAYKRVYPPAELNDGIVDPPSKATSMSRRPTIKSPSRSSSSTVRSGTMFTPPSTFTTKTHANVMRNLDVDKPLYQCSSVDDDNAELLAQLDAAFTDGSNQENVEAGLEEEAEIAAASPPPSPATVRALSVSGDESDPEPLVYFRNPFVDPNKFLYEASESETEME